MNGRLLTTLVVLPALAVGGLWVSTRGSGAPAPAPELVTAQRGEVAVTVGGVGHVATLISAARVAAPAADTGSGAKASSAAALANTAEAVFATGTGQVTALFVRIGEVVEAGQPIARIADNGASDAALVQARSDLATARLELAQKRVQDPTRGLPPTAAEAAFAGRSVRAAQDALQRLTGRPLPSGLAAARLEVAKAVADLQAARATAGTHPDRVAAAEAAAAAATQRLATLSGAPDPAELTAARLELAKAQLDRETLFRRPASPSPGAVAAADAAVASAEAALAAAESGGVATEIATATADLARARAERDALTQPPELPSVAAQAAANLAVEAAQARLDQLVVPPVAAVSAARSDLATALAEVRALQGAGSRSALAAAASSVTAARSNLRLLLHPSPESVSAANAEVARSRADLAVVRQRGSPASSTDLAIAGLRVSVAKQQVYLAGQLADRLTVRAPAPGTVTSILTVKGAPVDPTVALARVQDLNHLVLSVNLTEFDVSRTRVGALARISADALAGRRYDGHVLDIALTGSDTGGVVTFPVTVGLDESKDLRPGMSVSVRIVVTTRHDVVRLPVDALDSREGGRGTVTVRTPLGKLEQRRVRLGLSGGSFVEVRSGLTVGEKVVVPAGGGG